MKPGSLYSLIQRPQHRDVSVLVSNKACYFPQAITLLSRDRCARSQLNHVGTTQACLFRDEFTPLTATGFSIYGLSSDSPKSNTTFKTKQSLPYTLLCDPALNLIGAIGFKKAPKGTTRGVFVIDKQAKVLGAEAGGPAATVEVVRKLLTGKGTQVPDTDPSAAHEEAAEGSNIEKAVENGGLNAQNVETPVEANGTKEDVAKADVAADVADSAAKLDGGD